jgi:hypothetical protein
MTTPTWKELKAIVRGGESKIEAFLESLPDEHKTAGALALSVAHWDPSERTWIRARLLDRAYGRHCGLCHLFYPDPGCKACPLGKSGHICSTHAGDIWGGIVYSSDKRGFNRAADRMYNVLVYLYRQEWEKL